MGRRMENFTYPVYTAYPCRRNRLWKPWGRGLAYWIQIWYQSWLWTTALMSPYVMQFLRRMRNTVKKFYWHHIYDGRANIQHVSVLRDKSARFSQYLWRWWWYSDWATSTDTTATKIAVDIALLPSAECSSHLQRVQEERMTVGHNTSMTALSHFAFSCFISQIVTLLVVKTNRYFNFVFPCILV